MRFGRKKSILQIYREKKNYPITPAFDLGGRTFFEFADTNNQPGGRTLAAIPIYVALKTNCDENYLKVFVAAWEANLSDPQKISIEREFALKNQLKDRMQWAFTPDLVYKFASVIYFDENENPETYDEVYNEKKIEFWKQHATLEAFFLSEPISKLLPHLNAAKSSFRNYSDVILKAQRMQLEYLLDILSSSKTSPDVIQNLSSVITDLKRSYSSDHYPLTNTSISSTEKQNTSNN